jgi:DNA-binding NarL/FixJ family response regulator
MSGIRVAVVDDQPLYRAGVRMVLAACPNLEVVGEAGDGPTAVALARQLRPDVILMGNARPVLDGIEATRLIRAERPETRVILLSAREDVREALEALAAGACGYLLKAVGPEALIEAVERAAAGEYVLGPSVMQLILQEALEAARKNGADEPARAGLRLTRREVEILRLIARGRTNRQVAAELGISENTVKNHLRSVLAKLSLNRRSQAVRYARQLGLIE